jgi:hypothetical protein
MTVRRSFVAVVAGTNSRVHLASRAHGNAFTGGDLRAAVRGVQIQVERS